MHKCVFVLCFTFALFTALRCKRIFICLRNISLFPHSVLFWPTRTSYTTHRLLILLLVFIRTIHVRMNLYTILKIKNQRKRNEQTERYYTALPHANLLSSCSYMLIGTARFVGAIDGIVVCVCCVYIHNRSVHSYQTIYNM